jgi:phthiocerol/phenolphthiocerol synthesis type-I polyketide synthase C
MNARARPPIGDLHVPPESIRVDDSLHRIVLRHAQRDPDKAAIVFLGDGDHETERLSYAELDRRVRMFAAFLLERGEPGRRVLLPLPNGPEHAVALLGCQLARCIPVTVEPPLTEGQLERIARVADDCDARVVVHASSSGARERLAPLFDGDPDRQACTVTEILASRTDEPAKWFDEGDVPALIQYTSGSTGQPRGVVLTHANVMAHVRQIETVWRQDADELFVSWLPVYHDFGLVGGLMQPLFLGATAVILPTLSFLQRPMRWLRAIDRYRARATVSPPFGYELCAAASPEPAPLDLSCWKVAAIGAEPVRAATLQRFADRYAAWGFRIETFRPTYGMAEATLSISLSERSTPPVLRDMDAASLGEGRASPARPGAPSRLLVGNGRCWQGNELHVVEPQTGRLCAEGEIGELWLRGPVVAAGYWNRRDLTEAMFGAMTAEGQGPFLRSGDLGMVVDGELYVTGRLKDLIIVRGRNHSPVDLEACATEAHAALVDGRAAAFSVDGEGEEQVVLMAEVQRNACAALDTPAVVEAVRQRVLAEHGIHLAGVVLIASGELPVTSSGKVRRAACREAYLDGLPAPLHAWRRAHEAMTSSEAPLPASGARDEAALVLCLREAVARRRGMAASSLSLDAPFASFGLDSMEVVAMSGELSAQLDLVIEPTLVFDHPNIRALARHLARQEAVRPGVEGSSGASPRSSAEAAATARPADEPVAVIGMACRFPGAQSIREFWNLLERGGDAICDVPADRWAVDAWYAPGEPRPGKMNTRRGGFLPQVDRFDAAFFGITAREAQSVDPQQRLLLTVAWEALEDAGLPQERLAGSDTGVFIGIGGGDYLQAHARQGADVDAWIGTGTAFSVAANRISYFLDLRGPSVAIDTACSSSLTAVHEARKSLLAGECETAIVGGVNLMLSPETTVSMSQSRLLSPDGRCKSFDAQADGYVRGEGCGVVVLKRLADAERDGDRVLAVVAGSAINHHGRSNGLTAPNGPAQEAVVRKALASAGVAPGAVGCVEAHGTGTRLGDPIEVNALKAAYGNGTMPLWLSSVKTNIGHLEAASGMAGLVKAVLQLQHRVVVPHLHLQELNPLIDLCSTRLAIPQALQPWAAVADAPCLAGVHAFGIGGTNAHVVLREAPRAPASAAEPAGARLLTLSAHDPAALRMLAARFAALLAEGEGVSLAAICYTTNLRRSHHLHRLAVVAHAKGQTAGLLAHFAESGTATPGLFVGEAASSASLGPAGREAQGLDDMARRHVGGALVDWAAHWRDACAGALPPRPVYLPLYPFQEKRYWFEQGTAASLSDQEPVIAPAASARPEGDLVNLQPEAAKALLLDRLFELVARVTRLGDQHRAALRPGFAEVKLNHLGIDSLMAVELRNLVREELNADVPIQSFLDATTARAVADAVYQHVILDRLVAGHDSGAAPAEGGSGDETEEFLL